MDNININIKITAKKILRNTNKHKHRVIVTSTIIASKLSQTINTMN